MEHIEKVVGTFEKTDMPPILQEDTVSRRVVARLPRYHRYLRELLERGRLRISSAELSEMMGVTASQIRQDLNCFGGFGQQGYGYNVRYLYSKISELLGANEGFTTVIIGAGNLGRALATTPMFEKRGIRRLAMFDVAEGVVGSTVGDLTVYPLDSLEAFCRENRVDFAVLTTPPSAAEEIAGRLAHTGVRGIWNFTSADLTSHRADFLIENIHFSDSLMKLCFDLKNRAGVSGSGK